MTTTARPAHATAWRNAIFAVFALNGIGAATWVIRLPSMRDDLDLTVSQVGILIFGVSAGSIVGLLLASHLIQWLGSRRSILTTLLGCAVGLTIIGVGTSVLGSFAVVIIGMAIYGCCSAICDVAMNVEGAAVEKVIGRTLMPLFHASWSAGMVIGTGIGTIAAYQGVPVAVHLGIVAVALAAGAVVAPRAIPATAVHADTGEPVEHVNFKDRMSIWLEPRTLGIGLIALGMAFTEGAAGDWLQIGLIDDRGIDHGTAALLFTVFSASMMIGRIAGGPAIDRFGRVAVLRATGLSAAIGIALVIFVPVLPVIVAGIVLWGVGASLGFPIAMSAAADEPARAAARVSAVATVGYSAFLIGPPLLGLLGEGVGVLNALNVVLALIVLAVIAAPAARPPVKRQFVDATTQPNATEQQ